MDQTSPPAGSRTGPASGRYLPTLDGWRALAIAGVMACHALPSPATMRGAVGVNVFFAISGFLICSRLLEESRRSGRISLVGFYTRRSVRIFPAYFTYLSVLGALTAAGVLVVHRREFVSCAVFLRNYLPYVSSDPSADRGWYTGHFWSLAVEEHFYLIWPALLIFLGVRRARWAVAPLALGIGVWRVIGIRLELLDRYWPGVNFYMRTDVLLDGLFWGCWVALLLDEPAWRERLARWLTPRVWLVMAAAFVGSVAYRPPLHLIAEAALIPFLLVGTVLRPETLIGRLLEAAPMRWVGRLSFSLYLWQQLFLIDQNAQHPDVLRPVQTLPLSILAVFACATVSYYVVETPMIRLGRRLSSRFAPPTPHFKGAPTDSGGTGTAEGGCPTFDGLAQPPSAGLPESVDAPHFKVKQAGALDLLVANGNN
ncbi:MAG: acyltransferase, partial [Isosphaeraceae bacterium]